MAREQARYLRQHQTDTEIILWRILRNRRLGACKFRRRHPIGSYITDFASVEFRLVIEVDGGQHAESSHDERRTAWLDARGWRVVRFWNNDVLKNSDGVLAMILGEIALVTSGRRTLTRAALASRPLPQAGEVK
jgi:primosomal protein N' (replication factor Y)